MQYEIKELLDAALKSEHGIALHIDTPQETRRMRKRFYDWRERARKQGQNQYDSLSFLIRDLATQLWIVPRKEESTSVQAYLVRSLDSFEIPKKILARGKSRVIKP